MNIAHDPRWLALAARDKTADGQFVYGVRTTGVYCRPSCPSRTARPENVAFFAAPAEAEKAGFRACLRCRPDGESADQRNAALVSEACRLIEEADEMPGLDGLAAKLKVSPFHFHRLFKATTGLTPRAYGAAHRAKRVRDELSNRNGSVTAAIYDAGFNASSRFYAQSNAVLGMTPTRFRKGGKGAVIRFAVAECSLGALLVAQSDKGICAILLGDDPEALLRDLQDRFPAAELVGGDAGFEALVARVVAMVEAPGIGLDLPLDIHGTAFQQRVWQALQGIPAGETASYSEIAARIGAPKAVRAVAQACAANNVAVAVPCHRVVRSDGALSGYAWGIERKRELLRREGDREFPKA
ncbi:MAG: bifunctional DNA-binding transcriptional regulator/O6-methylguanine-DNA methyltransferase Ada [Methylobacterium mesophilicum]|nr:bifunctional DNA-binding transcriptional regulator/O6-methylguanine-DNA methyltransferase Ada [Methylobacterium mesophilicum]